MIKNYDNQTLKSQMYRLAFQDMSNFSMILDGEKKILETYFLLDLNAKPRYCFINFLSKTIYLVHGGKSNRKTSDN